MYKIIVKEQGKFAIIELPNNAVYVDELYFDSRSDPRPVEEVLAKLKLEQAIEEYDALPWYKRVLTQDPRGI